MVPVVVITFVQSWREAKTNKHKQTKLGGSAVSVVWLTAPSPPSRPPLPPCPPLSLSVWHTCPPSRALLAEVRCVCDCSAGVRFQEITCHMVVRREAGVHWTFPGIPPEHNCGHTHAHTTTHKYVKGTCVYTIHILEYKHKQAYIQKTSLKNVEQ